MPAAALKVKAASDPDRQCILEKLGNLSSVEIAQNEVLLAIYIRPEKTSGGIIVTANYRKEDEYQGKVGLVVKIGSACRFRRIDSHTGVEYGLDIKLHDWVVVRPSDTWALDVNSDPNVMDRTNFVKCRLAYDDMIRMRVESPGMIW
jgi:hypothetical protein